MESLKHVISSRESNFNVLKDSRYGFVNDENALTKR